MEDGLKKVKLPKNSFFRDSLFWYIVIVSIIYWCFLGYGIGMSETPGLNNDLSGKKYPLSNIEIKKISLNKEGMDFTPTVSKVEKVLEKIEKVEKEKGKVYYDKITTIEPDKVDGQYCYVKVIIKQKGNNITKEEILECADGRKKADGPSYWELFAEFYYRDVSAPEYCRYYSRPNHVFKSFGKTCLNKNGEWEVQ